MSDPAPRRGGELQMLMRTEAAGDPFVYGRDSDGELFTLGLATNVPSISVGRRSGNDLALAWDTEVSRAHAELRRVGDEWAVSDRGLSRNGTWVNGERVAGERVLRDDDRVRVGETILVYRDPRASGSASETAVSDAELRPELTAAQHRVLVALCRPLLAGGRSSVASNAEIEAEVSLGPDAVKGHLRAMFAKFALAELPQNRKRAALAESALRLGLVGERDL